MPIYHLSQSELVSLFESRARIAREAASRAKTIRDSAVLQSEAMTWDAAAKILSQSQLSDERRLTNGHERR